MAIICQTGACTDAIIAAIIRPLAAVAQLDRVLGYEPRGRGFDSCQPHHFFNLKPMQAVSCMGFGVSRDDVARTDDDF
jgi:hypothetical protein